MPHEGPQFIQTPLTRRGLLALAVTAGAGLAVGCGGPDVQQPQAEQTATPASASPIPNAPHKVSSVYIQAGIGEAEAQTLIETADVSKFNRGIASFYWPNPDATLQMLNDENKPMIGPGCVAYAGALAAGSELILAIGGYSDGVSNDSMATRWTGASQNVKKFAASLSTGVSQAEDILGRPVGGIELDWEVPRTAAEAKAFKDMISAYKDTNPDKKVGISVPASGFVYWDTEFRFPTSTLSAADYLSFMGYDYNGTWSKVAGDANDGVTTMNMFAEQVKETGAPEKWIVNFATYGRVFYDCAAMGEKFSQPQPGLDNDILYSKIPQLSVKDFKDRLASEARMGKDLVSCQSPAMIALTRLALYKTYPDLAGLGYWSSNGMIAGHAAAIQPA